MSVLIDVTPTVHEKFKNYKDSSTFRDKTDAELLEYFLDSFEVITCIVELGARTTAAPSNNPSTTTPDLTTDSTSSGNRQAPSIAYVQPFAAAPELQEATPSAAPSRILPNARKSTPTGSKNTTPTTASRLNSSYTDASKTSPIIAARRNTPVQSARKSTPSSSKAKKSTSTSPATCTRASNRLQVTSEISSSANEDLAALEYARNWRASILKRSSRISPGSSSTRRKSTKNSAGSRKPPPLAISPIPAVKTEPVDPADVIEQAMSVPLATVLDKINARQVPARNQPERTSQPDTTDNVDVVDQGNDTESYDPASIKETLKLQSKSKRRKTLTEKAKDLYEFNESVTSGCSSNSRHIVASSSNLQPGLLNNRPNYKSVAQLLFEAAFHTPTTSSGTVPSTTSGTISSLSPSTSNQTPNNVNIPSWEPISLQGLLTSTSGTDHNYSKTRRSVPESQNKTKSNKPFILTIKPVRSPDPDVASAISSGKPLSPQHLSNSLPPRSTSHATKSTAPIDSSRSHTIAGDSGRDGVPATSKQIGCSVCYRLFESKADFERHIKTVSTSKEFDPLTHKRINPLSTTFDLSESETNKFCRLCKAAFINRQALETHLANGCTIFPGLTKKQNRPDAASYMEQAQARLDTAITQQKSGENIRILNISQTSSPQSRSSIPPNSVPEHQISFKRSLPDTPPQPIAKKRPHSDLFSLTCTLCNQKFCECLISSRKYKSNYQKKPAENSPKTDRLNFPFPFDLDAVRAPDEKENTSHRANNLMLVNGCNNDMPVVSRKKSPPRVSEYESTPQKPKEKEVNATPQENDSNVVQVSVKKIPCSASDDPDGGLSSSGPPTKSCELLQQLENAIGGSKQKLLAAKSTTLSFEEIRYSELRLSSKPNGPIDRLASLTGPKEDPKEPPASAEISSNGGKRDTTNYQICTLTDEAKTSAVLRDCSLEDDDENIVSETEPLKEDIDTDDECGFSDSENDKVPEIVTNTESDKVPEADIVADLDNVTTGDNSNTSREHASGNLTKEAGVKPRGALSKIIADETATIDSGSEVEADDLVTDDELDYAFTDGAQESSHDVLIALNNFDELLRRHKLFDERIVSSHEDEYRNLCIADDDDDDGQSVSSGSVEDFCLDSDDECSLSDFDHTTGPGDPYPLVTSSSTEGQVGIKPASGTSSLVDQANEVEYPVNPNNESEGEVFTGRSSKRLKARALSINVRDSFLSGAPSPNEDLNEHKQWTWSKERPLFCGPCHKHFKNMDSLEKHELKHHSIA